MSKLCRINTPALCGFRTFSTPANVTALIKPNHKALNKVHSGAPAAFLNRKVRLYKPANSVTQSRPDTEQWRVDFGAREKWLNPLMGWTSTRDTSYQTTNMRFDAKEDAIRYCVNEGWEYTVEEPRMPRKIPKSYSSKFAWKGHPTN